MDTVKEFKENYEFYKELWWEMDSTFNLSCRKILNNEKLNNEKELNKILKTVDKYFDAFPKDKYRKKEWKRKGEEYLSNLISRDNIYKLSILTEKEKEGFINVTKKFILMAREFDKELKIEDIGQAMRNVWIINMLQALMGKEVNINEAYFGYSMLYPYTDNYLDNVGISIDEKKKFNDRFTKRLNGEQICSESKEEEKIYELVGYIERIYSRKNYDGLYKSLLEIHNGQILSLKQQERETIPYESDILGISIAKGGSSVLVDGYLMDGVLNSEEIKFCIGYGFILQLADDLQDINEDIKNGHTTIMSQLAGKYKLDNVINKLINLNNELLNNILRKDSNIKELILNDCLMLVLFSVALNKEFFSTEYICKIEEYLPYSIDFILEIKDRFQGDFFKLDEKKRSEFNKMIDEFVEK